MEIELQEEHQTNTHNITTTIIMVDNRQHLYTLFQTYYPGRYYEWLQSMFNNWNKPYKNCRDQINPYKDKFVNWPSRGGPQYSTFVE